MDLKQGKENREGGEHFIGNVSLQLGTECVCNLSTTGAEAGRLQVQGQFEF